jgi:glycosyltransferase involved in cell wall biosynthesis
MEKYLQKCLESLVSQTLQDMEIICVNDGSTDRSGEIINSYAAKDSRIKVINKANTGYGHTCNVGLDAAASEYVAILESDDFVDKNMYSDLYALITENNCDIVKCEWWEYTGKNKKTMKAATIITKLKPGKISSTKEKKKFLKSPASIWSFLYKKSFLDENNIRFLETPGASYQDTSFNFKVVTLAKDIYITSNAYIYYRKDNLSCSTLRQDGGEFIFEEYEEINRFLNEHPDLKEIYKGRKFHKEYDAYSWNLKRVAPKYRKECFEKFVDAFRAYYENGELDDKAFEFLSKSKAMLLVNDPKKAWKKFQWKFIETAWKKFRRSFISVRINHKRASVEILGKQIVRIE